MLFDQLKREALRRVRGSTDRKVAVDADIVDLVELVNAHEDYVVNSSCSGRIAVFCGMTAPPSASCADKAAGSTTPAPGPSTPKSTDSNATNIGGKWILAEHGPITFDQFLDSLQSPHALDAPSGMMVLKHEPLTMHILCRDIEAAQRLLQWGFGCGFRESGIVVGNNKVMCAIRTSANAMEIPLGCDTRTLYVDESYLRFIIDVTNDKFHANAYRAEQMLVDFARRFGVSRAETSSERSDSQSSGGDRSTATEKEPFKIADIRELQEEPIQRIGHSSVRIKNEIIVFGGQKPTSSGSTERAADLTVLSVSTDDTLQVAHRSNSEETESGPRARMQHSAVVVNDLMIIFGGRAAPTKPFDDLFSFNPVTKKWKALEARGDVPSPRWKHTTCVVGSTMYVFGGRDSTTVFGDLYALDMTRNELAWEVIDNTVDYPRFDHIGVVIEKTKLLFWGGMSSSRAADEVDEDEKLKAERRRATCLVFDTVKEEWNQRTIQNPLDGPAAGLIAAQACAMSETHVLVAGGMTPASLVSGENETQKLFILNTAKMEWISLGEVNHPNAAFAYHTCTWMPQNECAYLLGGGFQYFGFDHFYSSAFVCNLSIAPGALDAIERPPSSKKSSRPSRKDRALLSTTNLEKRPMAALAEKHEVKQVKSLLERCQVYDSSRRVNIAANMPLPSGGTGTVFLIPVTADISNAQDEHEELAHLTLIPDDDKSSNKRTKASGLNRNEIVRSIILLFATKHRVPVPVQNKIPDKYEFVGDFLMVPRDAFLEKEWKAFDQKMWAQVCASVSPPFSRVARKAFMDPNDKRLSRVELLYVNHKALPSARCKQKPGWVEVRENGIIYGWDITQVMFSSGNTSEKLRMGALDCKGETIVDLFSGIGYYTLPFIIHGEAAFVHACEWNPESSDALRFNLDRNHVSDRCQIHLGDNQETVPALGQLADRVLLEMLPSSEKAWELAVQTLKPRGGWMHIHANVPVDEREQWTEHLVSSMTTHARRHGRTWTIKCTHVEKVKSSAPKVHHVVADLYCS